MPKYVAFLRAINVGGHTVRMSELKRLFEAMGFTGVETFIASGNVIFETRSAKPETLERKIEAQLREALGYAVSTFIRSFDELSAITRVRPFPQAELDDPGHALYIGFLAASPDDAAKRKLRSFDTPTDQFDVRGREVYWLAHKGMGASELSGAVLEKALGMPMTMRNSTTVRKLAAKYC